MGQSPPSPARVCGVDVNTAQPPVAGLADLTWTAFAAKVTGELAGAFHVTKRVVEVMRVNKRGTIVYIGSTAADYVGGGRIAHGIAKNALAAFARHVTAETAKDGIAVLTVAFAASDEMRVATGSTRAGRFWSVGRVADVLSCGCEGLSALVVFGAHSEYR